MIEFSCPECSQPQKVRSAAAGKNVKCTGCGATIEVPQHAGMFDHLRSYAEDKFWEEQGYQPKSGRSSSKLEPKLGGILLIANELSWKSDATWQLFGFRRRPRRCRLFNFLVPRWRVKIELLLRRELFLTTLSLYIALGSATVADIARLLDWLRSTPPEPFSLWRLLGYHDLGCEHEYDALADICQAIDEYTSVPTFNWSQKMLERVQWRSVPDPRFRDGIARGCVTYIWRIENSDFPTRLIEGLNGLNDLFGDMK